MSLREEWTCRGDNCGDCGKVHRSLAASAKCIERDARAIRRFYGRNVKTDRVSVRYTREITEEL